MATRVVDETLIEMAQRAGVTVAPGDYPVSRTLEAHGLRLHYLEWGDVGHPVIVFIHGGAQTAHMWDFAALALRDRYRCIAVDQRGHGDSQWAPDGDYSLSAFQRDLEAAVQTLGLARFTLVGLSLGGRNAYVFAANHPDLVNGLVVVDTGPEGREAGRQEISQFMRLPDLLDSFDDFVARAAEFSPMRPVDQVRGSLRHNVKQLPNGKWTWKYDRALREGGSGIGRPPTEYLWSCVDRVRCPTLIVRGGDSRVFLVETAEAMARRIPNCTLVTVPGAGHRVPGDQPREFERRLVPFIDSLRRR